MNKKNWVKIKDNGVLDVKDLTADEKKRLYAVMERWGMSKTTCYSRFFYKGFDSWELQGITKVINEFLLTAVFDSEEGNRGYGYVLSLMPDYDDSKFYELITNLKIGVRFCDYMSARGMTSQMTVRTRFKAYDWKPWELVGIGNILDKELTDE